MKKIVTVFLIFFIVLTTVIGTAMYFQLKPEVNKAIEVKKEEETFDNLDVSNYKERINILLLGVDTLTTDKDQTGTRSDTIMILSMDPTTKTGFILSIPRDSYVKIYDTDNYTKINHAHSYGGTNLAISTIKEFVNIPIHHYVKVDYKALFKTVDDLGGIEFDVPQDMDYEDKRATPPLKIHLKKGIQLLDGDKAMQLIRYRKGYADQDFGRVKVQRDFIKAVLKKIYAPSSITKIPKFAETIYDYVETDMSLTDILSFMKVGMSINLDEIEMVTAPGADGNKPGAGSVVIIDEAAFKEQMEYLLSSEYEIESVEDKNKIAEGVETQNNIVEETTAPNAKKTAEEINKYIIVVLNGSGISGAARRASDLLKIQNIEVDSSGNASSYDNDKTMIYYKDDAEIAKQIKDIIKVGSIKSGTKTLVKGEPDIVILLGKDFN